MPRFPFSFGPNSNPSRSKQLGDGRLFNAFVTPLEKPSKDRAEYTFTADPGLEEFSPVDEEAVATRGMFDIPSLNLYAVVGENLYKIDQVGGAVLLGPVSGVRPVITSVNNNATARQAVITADVDVYQLQSDVLQSFQDVDLGSGVTGTTFIDGYTVILLRSGIFQWTDINTLDIDALSFAEAEARSDGGVLPLAFESKLWLFGVKTIEVWSDVGTDADLPFERDTVIERGALSKYAIIPFDETLAFVDDIGRVCRMVGYGVQVISTPAVELDIRRSMDLQLSQTIEAFAWTTAGHQFFVLCGHDWTWVYDAALKMWHNKDSFGQTKWRGRGYIYYFDKHLVGSHVAGKLYHMSHEIHDEDGEPLIKRLRSAIIGAVDKLTEFNQLDLDIGMAAGLLSSDGNEADPQVQLRWSDNGGHTWSMPRIQAMGRIGKYAGGKLRFTRLGTCMSGRGRMFELVMSHPVKRMTLEAVAMIEEAAA